MDRAQVWNRIWNQAEDRVERCSGNQIRSRVALQARGRAWSLITDLLLDGDENRNGRQVRAQAKEDYDG